MLLTIIGVTLTAAIAPAAGINPIAPALAGQLECQKPDEQAKTCRAIASYKPLGGSRYSNTALILLSPQPSVTLEVTSEVELKKGAICGFLRAEDFAKGHLTVGGRALNPDEAAPALAQMAQGMTSLFGKEACTTYEPTASGLTTRTTLDGIARPEFDRPVKLVAPGDNYRVAP